MKHYQSSNIKNIAILGGSKAGKTTLAECMMFEGGVINRMGSIEDKNTISDYHEVEHERQNSVYSSIMHTEWRGTKINIIDTPGLDDFIGEVIPALRVANTGLLVLNAQNGVEVGTEIMMRYLRKYAKPTVIVVNQIDHAKADFDGTLESINSQFSENVIVVQYPYNAGDGFDSIIDVLKMVMYKFPPEGGKPEKLPIPADQKDRADDLHNQLVEAAAENDEDLMELYFDEGTLSEDQLRDGIRKGMLARSLLPLFCVASKKNMGSGRLMGFIGNVAPSAADVAPEVTTEEEEIKTTDGDTTLFVFKAANEKHAGSVGYFKVCAGELTAGMELTDSSTGNKAKMNQLYIMDGKNRSPVDKLSAGDIGATVKYKGANTNNTLRASGDGKKISPLKFPNPRIRVAISPTKSGDEEKMGASLNKMHEGDPTLIMELSKELKQTILHAQGELHLQTAKWTLNKEYGVGIEFDKPRISYRETIRSEASASYKHKKQSGGSGQFGEVFLRIFPWTENVAMPTDLKVRNQEEIELDWGGKLLYCSAIVGGSIDTRFMPAILKGINEVIEEGPLTKSYARDIVVIVYDGKMHPVDSNEISFKIAGGRAFKDAFLQAKPMLLEPIYRLKVLTPDDYTGDIMTDLQGRRAIVEGIDSEGNLQKITARVPLAELYKYTTTLSSIAQGRAAYEREFLEYSMVPSDVQARLVKELAGQEDE